MAKQPSKQRQMYGKGSVASQKHPTKKPGLHGDKGRSKAASPLFRKRK